MRLIDADALYEKTANWEAQALHMVEVTMYDEDKLEEWRKWSTVLTERSAFKHDIADAPTIVQQEVKKISYADCADAMLMMWMDKVLTDGEYDRIMDKLNAHEMEQNDEE